MTTDAKQRGGAARRGKHVIVRDGTPAQWRPLVAATVDEFNAMLPKRAPRLIYHVGADEGCGGEKSRRSITVCVAAQGPSGLTRYRQTQRGMIRAVITLDAAMTAVWDRDHVLCHEFMHATTGAPEVAKGNNRTSCLWGILLNSPGRQDRAYAHEAYAREKKKKHHHRHK